MYDSRYGWKSDKKQDEMPQTIDKSFSTMADERPEVKRVSDIKMPTIPEMRDNAGTQQQMMVRSNDTEGMMPMQKSMMMQSGNMPENLSNPIYTAGYLSGQLGRLIKVEYISGGETVSKVGRLIEVGASYILLQSAEPGSVVLCDIDSIAFATIAGFDMVQY